MLGTQKKRQKMKRINVAFIILIISCSFSFAQHKVSIQPISMIFGLPLVEGREWKANYFYQYNEAIEYTVSGSVVKVTDGCTVNIDCIKSNLSRELVSVGWKYIWKGIYGNPKIYIGHSKYFISDLEQGISKYNGLNYGGELMIGYQYAYEKVFSFIDGGIAAGNLGREVDINFGIGYIF